MHRTSTLLRCLLFVASSQLAACSFIATQRPQQALAEISIPVPPTSVPRPRVLLSVEQQPWDDAEAATRPEYDLVRTNRMRQAFIHWAEKADLFKEVLLDPFELRHADYRITLGIRLREDPHGNAKIMATGLTYGLITTTTRNDFALAVEVRDRKGVLLGKQALQNTDLRTAGLGALGIAKPPITTAPADIEEELVMKAARFIAQSRICAPRPAPATKQPPKPKPSTMGKPALPPAGASP